jgi:hypothetical protein
MTLLSTLKEEQARREAVEATNILKRLIQRGQYVGDVYSIGYEFANVEIHDSYRETVGGIPSLCFLVATRIPLKDEELDYRREESSVILLRVMDSTPLPSDAEAERVRVEIAQRVAGEVDVHWDHSDNMDPFTHNLLSFAGVKCRVIGTFFVDESKKLNKPVLRFGSDLSNYYPNRGLKVYKPNQEALFEIVNYVDIDRVKDAGEERVDVGEVRYASTNRSFQGVTNVTVKISPADLLGQKTALFGMTRTGKSNTTKIILQSVFNLRFAKNKPRRIGQIVFDPNGEYANENEQDENRQKNPDAIKNVWQGNERGEKKDVMTYGMLTHPHDPDRKPMRLNFFADSTLQEGKQIIDTTLADYNALFVQNFCQVVFEKPDESDASAKTRFDRAVLVYRALLAKAGLEVPKNLKASTIGIGGKSLFNSKLLESMRNTDEADYQSAAKILAAENTSWDQLSIAFENLNKFTKTPEYKTFESWYVNERPKASGNKWVDPTLERLLKMFDSPNGARQVGKVKTQHSSKPTSDYAADIYKDLIEGRLVIVDQSSGDELVNKSSAKRIMRKIFEENQSRFRKGDPDIPEILVYVEEAHNLLPTGTDLDPLDVWVRTAKEGAKYHIGLVYATQEVSSIQPNILKNTANWFIGHLNNTDETAELRKYYDFADFESSIRRAQDQGFLRVKTLSNLFVVPVQVRKFEVR